MVQKLLGIPIFVVILIAPVLVAVFVFVATQKISHSVVGPYTHSVTHAPKMVNFESSSSASISATQSAKVKLNGPTKH